jgi:hypothetical protein
MFTLLNGLWCTWSGPAGDPGALLDHDISPRAQLEDRWRYRFRKNINKFKQILQTVIVKIVQAPATAENVGITRCLS